ncbi:MAG: hypothetical protein WC551_02620 [Patescibacteria group bacterium]
MESTGNKVLIAVLHQGLVRPELFGVLLSATIDKRFQTSIRFYDLKPSENNRNQTVKDALDEGFDYLISIDHDVVPMGKILDLVDLDKDVVGCACPQWNMSDPHFPIYFVGMDRVEGGYKEHKDRNGLQEVDAVGSGAICMSRKVLEAVKEPFCRKWKDGFAVTGLDFYFCEKAKEQGFKVFCHYGIPASHFKDINLMDAYNALAN